MGMSGASGGRRPARRRGRIGGSAGFTDINVTPLVDVMLVLLIVFMVAAPLMTVGVPIDLPKMQAQAMQPERKPVTVTVSADGALSIASEPVAAADLVTAVAARAPEGTGERLYVRGDTAASYGTVMEVMGTLSGAGYSQIGLITEQQAVR